MAGKKMSKEHFEVLLENINSTVQQIAEGHVVLNNKIDNVEKRLSAEIKDVKGDIKVINLTLNALNNKIDDVEIRLTQKIDSVDEKLSKRIDEVDEKLTGRMNKLDNRMGNLEVKVDKLDNRTSNIEVKVGSIDKKLDIHMKQPAHV